MCIFVYQKKNVNGCTLGVLFTNIQVTKEEEIAESFLNAVYQKSARISPIYKVKSYQFYILCRDLRKVQSPEVCDLSSKQQCDAGVHTSLVTMEVDLPQ